MNAASADVAVVQAGVEILKNIANDDAGINACVAAGAPVALVAALNTHTPVPDVCNMGCWALARISTTDAGRDACVAAGAPAAVVAVLNANPNNIPIFDKACDFMLNLAGSGAGKDALVTAGAVPKLVEGIAVGEKEIKARDTLSALGYGDDGVELLGGGGGGGGGGDKSENIWKKLVAKVVEIETSNDDTQYDGLLEDFKALLNEYIISNINEGCEDPVTVHYEAMFRDETIKLFDNDTKNLQEKLKEIYEMTRKLYKKEENPKTNEDMSVGDIYNAIMGGYTDGQGNIIEEGYITNVFAKLITDGHCKKVEASPPPSPPRSPSAGGTPPPSPPRSPSAGGTPPPLVLGPAAKRKTRQSGGSRNRRITPIGKKIGGISLKKRTPKSKKKSRSKK